MKCRLVSLLILGALVLSAPIAQATTASPLRVLVCYPGGPGSTEEAAPRLAEVFGRVATLAGWDADRVEARYVNNRDACDLYLKEQKPQLAILSLGMFLSDGARLKSAPVLEVIPVGGEAERYHVVVEADPATSLAELNGKAMAGELLGDPVFLSKVVFQGTIDVASHFELKDTRTALRAIKLVHSGKVAAALLDTRTFAELKTLPFGDALRAVFVSEPLPGWPVLALGDTAPGDRLGEADRKALVDALVKVCADDDGKKTCEQIRLGGFRSVADDAYAAVRKLYGATE